MDLEDFATTAFRTGLDDDSPNIDLIAGLILGPLFPGCDQTSARMLGDGSLALAGPVPVQVGESRQDRSVP